MARRVEVLVERLRGRSGTPRELAVFAGCDAGESSFRRALALLVQRGELVAVGSTRDRRYVPALPGEAELAAGVDRALEGLVPCSAREFSQGGHRLGLYGSELGARKASLGLVTCRGADGRWVVRAGVCGQGCNVRPDAETFAHMAAVAYQRATNGVIAGKSREPVT